MPVLQRQCDTPTHQGDSYCHGDRRQPVQDPQSVTLSGCLAQKDTAVASTLLTTLSQVPSSIMPAVAGLPQPLTPSTSESPAS